MSTIDRINGALTSTPVDENFGLRVGYREHQLAGAPIAIRHEGPGTAIFAAHEVDGPDVQDIPWNVEEPQRSV